MCFPSPLAIGGMALGAGGSYLAAQEQSKNAKRIARAQAEAQQAEVARQHAFQSQAGGVFSDTLGRFQGPAQEQIFGDAATSRTGTLETAFVPRSDYTSVPTSTPQIVRDSMQQKLASVFADLKARAGTLGKLGAWDDRAFENALGLNRSGNRLTDISSMAGGSASVLPYEMNSATNNAYRAPGIIPDLLQLGGMGLGLAGMTGNGPNWKQVFGTGRDWAIPWQKGPF